MQTTRGLLSAIKERYGLTTDGQLARFLGLSRERVSRYQHGSDYLGEETALKVAAALDLEAGYVLACVAAERTKQAEVRKAWESLAKKAAATVALALLAVGALAGFSYSASDFAAAFMALAVVDPGSGYYVKYSVELATQQAAAQVVVFLSLLAYAALARRVR